MVFPAFPPPTIYEISWFSIACVKMKMSMSGIAYNIVVGSIESWPTEGITKDIEDALSVDSSSESSLCSSCHQKDKYGPEKHHRDYAMYPIGTENCFISPGC